MELAVVALSVACVVQAVVLGVLLAFLPSLLSRVASLEAEAKVQAELVRVLRGDVDVVDEAVDALCVAAGLTDSKPAKK